MWLAALKTLWQQVGRANRLIETYRRAAQGTSDHGLAHVNWGVALAELGELQESLGKFERATQLSAHRSEPWINWGVALAKLGRLNEAIVKFERASQIEPERGSIYMLWGAALLELGEPDHAQPHYERAIALNPRHPEPWINWAIALARHGQYAAATERLKKALTLKPSQPQVQFLLGAVLAECGQYAAAIEHFEQAVKLQPRHDEALYFWAVSLNRLSESDNSRASEKIRQALQLNPDRADYYLCLGDILTRQGKLDLAAVNYRHAVGLAPQRADAAFALGTALCRLGRHVDGRQQFERAAQLCPDLADLDLEWGLSLLATGDTQEAPLHLERALLLNSAQPAAMLAMARILVGQGQWERAQLLLEQAVEVDPEHPQTCALIAQSYLEHLDRAQAHRWLNRSLTQEGYPLSGADGESAGDDRLEAMLLSALLALADGQVDEALRRLRPLLRQRPQCPRVRAYYALALMGAGEVREAQRRLAEPLAGSSTPEGFAPVATEGRLEPDVYPVLASLEIALREGRLEQAHSLWQGLADRMDLPPVALWLSARLYGAQLGAFSETASSAERHRLKETALARLEQTLRRLPTCGEAWRHWLGLQLEQGEGQADSWIMTAHQILEADTAPAPAIRAVFAWACQQTFTSEAAWEQVGMSHHFPWLAGLIGQGLADPGLNGALLWRSHPWLRQG